jgi:hypothetical protein
MYKLSIYLVVSYFPTYLPIYETYFLQYRLPRWNQRLTQWKFIHNWVIMGIQQMGIQGVHFGPSTVLVHFVSVMKATSPSDLFLANFSILSSEK